MKLSPAHCRGLLAACGALVAACHSGGGPHTARADVATEQWRTPSPCDTVRTPPLGRGVPLSAVNPDSVARDVQARRAAWRARDIRDYRVRIGMRCFCPYSPPAVLEVRRGIPVALRDSAGRSAGAVNEAYPYTVEGLFDLIERAARNDELVEVAYSPCLGYPASVRVDPKGLDNWYWVTADHLTTPR